MKITCFLSFLLLFQFASAQVMEPNIEISSFYAIDSNSQWDKNYAHKQKAISFKVNEKINIGYNKYAAVWCYFKIKNSSVSKDIKTWLCFNNYHIDSLTLFDAQRVQLLGDRTSNQSPFLESFAFEIDLSAKEEKLVLVRLKKQTSYLEFSYQLEHSASLQKKSSKKTALVAFFVGIVFILLMINSILYKMTRNSIYICYIAYSLLTVLYAIITTNFAKHFLFTEFLFFSEARVFTGALWFIALSYFLSQFLKLKQHQTFKYRLIVILCLIDILFIIISIILLVVYPNFDFSSLFMAGYFIFMCAIFTLFWAALVHLRIDRQQAIYALFAFAPQFIWVACVILRTFEIIPTSLGDNWMVFASLYEVFLFGFVLSRNYLDVFIRNNELMQEVIQEKEHSLKTINVVQLRERRNIANIIHDNVGSKIAHIMHLFDMKNTKLAKQTIADLAGDIREISHKILPKALDEGGLLSSLRSQISILNGSLTDTEIEIFSYDFPERIDERWIHDLYLISLELINNSIKHGKAKLITIELYKYDTNYHFQFTDDGQGFDPQKTPVGFGLNNIEKRVNSYQGYFEISSVVNQGSIVQIDMPI